MTYSGNCRLGDLFTSRREKGRPGLPTLSVTLNDGLVNREDMDRKQDTTLTPEEHLLVKPGDIAYNMMRMWQGAFGLADREGLVSPAYVVLKAKKGIDPLYASYLFKTARMKYLFWAYSYGLTDDRLRLYPSDIGHIPAFVPALSRQRKVAEALSIWDKSIKVINELICATTLQRKALANELLSGASRLHGFSDTWKRYHIREMGKVVAGGTPDTDIESYWGGTIPWATPTDIAAAKGRYISTTARQITNEGLKASAATKLPAGSLLVCTRATICELAISTTEIATNQGFKSVIAHEGFSVEFLYHLFATHKRQFFRLACGSTFLELSKRDFERMTFAMPTREEQDAIALCINTFDDQVAIFNSALQRLEQEKAALLQGLAKQKICSL